MKSVHILTDDVVDLPSCHQRRDGSVCDCGARIVKCDVRFDTLSLFLQRPDTSGPSEVWDAWRRRRRKRRKRRRKRRRGRRRKRKRRKRRRRRRRKIKRRKRRRKRRRRKESNILIILSVEHCQSTSQVNGKNV